MLTLWALIFLMNLFALSFLIKPFFFGDGGLLKLGNQKMYFHLICLFLGVSLTSISLYLFLGNSHAVEKWLSASERAKEVQVTIKKMGSRQNIIEALKARLAQIPENKDAARGWYLLGKLYLGENKLKEAGACFQKASQLSSDPEYLLQSVSINFYLNKRLDKKDKSLLAKLLLKSPTNINAINLLALDAYQQKNMKKQFIIGKVY